MSIAIGRGDSVQRSPGTLILRRLSVAGSSSRLLAFASRARRRAFIVELQDGEGPLSAVVELRSKIVKYLGCGKSGPGLSEVAPERPEILAL